MCIARPGIAADRCTRHKRQGAIELGVFSKIVVRGGGGGGERTYSQAVDDFASTLACTDDPQQSQAVEGPSPSC
jgi:hypothetical protein